jgi:tetratricopeptide (TPR) repeat protein
MRDTLAPMAQRLRNHGTNPNVCLDDISCDLDAFRAGVVCMSTSIDFSDIPCPESTHYLLMDTLTGIVAESFLQPFNCSQPALPNRTPPTALFVLQGTLVTRDQLLVPGMGHPVNAATLAATMERVAGSTHFSVLLFVHCDPRVRNDPLLKRMTDCDYVCPDDDVQSVASFPLPPMTNAALVVELTSSVPLSFALPASKMLPGLMTRCPAQQEEQSSVMLRHCSCLSFRFASIFLHRAIVAEELVALFESHFPEMRGIIYSQPADIERWKHTQQEQTAQQVHPTFIEVIRNHWPIFACMTSPQEDVALVRQLVQQASTISRESQVCVLRTILQCMPNRPSIIRQRVIASQSGARDRLTHAVRSLGQDDNAAAIGILRGFSEMVASMSLAELVEVLRPCGAPSTLTIVQQQPQAATMSQKIGRLLAEFQKECVVNVDPVATAQLLANIFLQHTTRSIEGVPTPAATILPTNQQCTENNNMRVATFVLAGGCVPANQSALGSYRSLIQTNMRRILTSIERKVPGELLFPITPQQCAYKSVIILATLACTPGQQPPPLDDGDHLNCRFYKGIVLRLWPFNEWTFLDFLQWMTQLAWVNHLLDSWSPCLAAIPASLAFRDALQDPSKTKDWLSSFKFGPAAVNLVLRQLEAQKEAFPPVAASNETRPEQPRQEKQHKQEKQPPQSKLTRNEVDGMLKEATALLRSGNAIAAISKFEKCQGSSWFTNAERAQFLFDRGVAHEMIGELSTAIPLFLESIKYLPPPENDIELQRLALVYNSIAFAYQRLYNWPKAQEYYALNQATFLKMQDGGQARVREEGRYNRRIALLYYSMGNHVMSDKLIRTGYTQSQDDQAELAEACAHLGYICYEEKMYEPAFLQLSHARHAYGELGDRRGEAIVRGLLGKLLVRWKRDLSAALSHFQQQLSLSSEEERHWSRRIQGIAQCNIGDLYMEKEDLANAEQAYTQSLQHYQSLADEVGAAHSRSKLALVHDAMKKPEQAEQQQRQSIVALEAFRLSVARGMCATPDEPMLDPDGISRLLLTLDAVPIYRQEQVLYISQGNPVAALVSAEKMRAHLLMEMNPAYKLNEVASAITAASILQCAEESKCTFVHYSLRVDLSRICIWVVRPDGSIHYSNRWFDLHVFLMQLALFDPNVARHPRLASTYARQIVNTLHISVTDPVLKQRKWDTARETLLGLHELCMAPPSFPGFDNDISFERIKNMMTAALDSMYYYLIGPMAEHLPTGEHELVVFVPDGPLFNVPFAALWDWKQKKHLIQMHTVAVTPSICFYSQQKKRKGQNIWNRMRALRQNESPRATILSSSSEDLAGNIELWSERGVVATAHPWSRAKEDLKSTLETATFIHVSSVCLGVSGIEKARLMPWTAATRLCDNMDAALANSSSTCSSAVSIGEIGQLTLGHADMVLLDQVSSGYCSDTTEPIPYYGIMAAMRMFLKAGAQCVITSPSSSFASAFYKELFHAAGGDTKADILRRVQLSMIAQGHAVLSWANASCVGVPSVKRDVTFGGAGKSKRRSEAQLSPNDKV